MKIIAPAPEPVMVDVTILRNGVHIEAGGESVNKGAIVSVSPEMADMLRSKGLAK